MGAGGGAEPPSPLTLTTVKEQDARRFAFVNFPLHKIRCRSANPENSADLVRKRTGPQSLAVLDF